MINYKVLTKREALACRGLTFPSYHHLLTLDSLPRHLNTQEANIKPLAIGAISEGEIVGLVLAEFSEAPKQKTPELLSIYVNPETRLKGVATNLLKALEEEVQYAGYEQISVVYMSGRKGTDALERLLKRCHWKEPETRMVSVKFTPESLKEAPWLNKYKLNSYYEILPWADISIEEKGEIWDSQKNKPWIPEDLVPWKHDQEEFEPITSMGIRYKGEVVGWVINHLIEPQILRYTCSFIRKDLSRLGRILPAYSESFNRISLLGAEQMQCCYTTPLEHKEMALFAKRWFGPWSTYLGETKGTIKDLSLVTPS